MSVDLVPVGEQKYDIPDEFGSLHWQQDNSFSASRKTSYSMSGHNLTALELELKVQRSDRASDG
jgi:hypothetical protein